MNIFTKYKRAVLYPCRNTGEGALKKLNQQAMTFLSQSGLACV